MDITHERKVFKTKIKEDWYKIKNYGWINSPYSHND